MIINKKLIHGMMIISILFSSCYVEQKNTAPKSEYLKKFAGSYTIEVEGFLSDKAVEVYALNENGKASWLWIENDDKEGAKVDSRKIGTWSANENRIIIKIKGKYGVITETYEYNKDSVLTNIQLGQIKNLGSKK